MGDLLDRTRGKGKPMSEPTGLLQCPRCFGPSETAGWCLACQMAGLGGFFDKMRKDNAAEVIEAELKKAIDSYGYTRHEALLFEQRVFAIVIADTVIAVTVRAQQPIEFWAPTVEKYRYITDQLAIENAAIIDQAKDKGGDN